LSGAIGFQNIGARSFGEQPAIVLFLSVTHPQAPASSGQSAAAWSPRRLARRHARLAIVSSP
jgi:hypothetical protein